MKRTEHGAIKKNWEMFEWSCAGIKNMTFSKMIDLPKSFSRRRQATEKKYFSHPDRSSGVWRTAQHVRLFEVSFHISFPGGTWSFWFGKFFLAFSATFHYSEWVCFVFTRWTEFRGRRLSPRECIMFQHGMCGWLESVFIFLSREEPGISIFKVFLAWLSYISLLKVELWKFFTLWTEFRERTLSPR